VRIAARALCRDHGAALLLAALAPAGPWLEATMARHMGLEVPALLMLGGLAVSGTQGRWPRVLQPWNAGGLTGLLCAMCIAGFWMLPVALDRAVLHEGMAIAKVASLGAAGGLVRRSWPMAGPVIQAFVVLNGFWMTCAAGLLYQEAPQQLCSVYLADQQAAAGRALVGWAAAGLGIWGYGLVRAHCMEGAAGGVRARAA
jgi:hypothetical protein